MTKIRNSTNLSNALENVTILQKKLMRKLEIIRNSTSLSNALENVTILKKKTDEVRNHLDQNQNFSFCISLFTCRSSL